MVLYIVIAVMIVGLIGGMVLAIRMNNEAERRARVMNVVGSQKHGDGKGKKGNVQDQRRADLARKLKEVEEDTGKKKKEKSLDDMIMQAGFEFSVQRFWVVSALLGIVATVLAYVMGYSLFVTGMVGITAFLGLPRMFLNMSAKRRQKKFLADFADALEAMTRLLKAGMPVTEAIKMVSREFTGPIGEEMGRIFDQQKIGIPLPEAVLAGSKRMPIPEMQMFATAIAIQTQTGSSLSEVLTNLANVIRARFRLKRKVQALSSEAKASAGIIGALPCVVALGLYFINREYIEVLFIDPTGKFLLGLAVGWMALGVLVMRQMINFKVKTMFGITSDLMIVIGSALAAALSFAAFALPLLRRGEKKERYRSVIEKRRKALFQHSRDEIEKKGQHKTLSAKESVAVFFKVQQLAGEMGEKIRDKLLLAGIRDPMAPLFYIIAQIVLPIVFCGLSMLFISGSEKEISSGMTLMIIFGAIFAGFFLPRILVKNAGIKRQLDLSLSFPDALDMMLICVQGGIGLEQAIDRVAEEVAEHAPILAEELGILSAEMAMLSDRRAALSDFGRRVGGFGKSFAAALIQAEQYGASVSQALRVQADELRDMRMAAAEQKAASLPPKLTVPMILFFLPALFIVILGPAGIEASRSFGGG